MSDETAAILTVRAKTHGPYHLHATITQRLKGIIWSDVGGYASMNDSQRECLDMIAHKIGRILAGDPNHEDHWRDLAGYAILVANELRVPDGKQEA